MKSTFFFIVMLFFINHAAELNNKIKGGGKKLTSRSRYPANLSYGLTNFLNKAKKSFFKRNQRQVLTSRNQIKWTVLEDKTLVSQSSRDALMFYKTLYPENEITFENEEINDTNQRINSLKRFVAYIAMNGFLYSTQDQLVLRSLCTENINVKKWPHSLATFISHGGRTIFLIPKGTGISFRDELFPQNYNRHFSTHQIRTEGGFLFEAKINSAQSFLGLFKPTHFGFDFPYGGLGNLWPLGTCIRSSGLTTSACYLPLSQSISNAQNGHFFLRADEHRVHNINNPAGLATLMVGFEGEKVHSKGMFSTMEHGEKASQGDPSDRPGVQGGTKFAKIIDLNEKPSQYGGRCVRVNTVNDQSITNMLMKIGLLGRASFLEQFVWWILLQANSSQATEFIKEVVLNMNQQDLIIFLSNILNH